MSAEQGHDEFPPSRCVNLRKERPAFECVGLACSPLHEPLAIAIKQPRRQHLGYSASSSLPDSTIKLSVGRSHFQFPISPSLPLESWRGNVQAHLDLNGSTAGAADKTEGLID